MTGLTTRGAGFAILCAMAENGPATREQFDAIAATTGCTPLSVITIAKQLRQKGYLVQKIMLTPAGLAELQRLGWKPDLSEGDA